MGDWDAKVGSQEIPRITSKFALGVENEAGQRLTEFCQENALVIVNSIFKQPRGQLYIWTLPDGEYWNQTDYVLHSQRWRSTIQSAKKTSPGADCGSDHELLITKFGLKWKKVGKTTRPFRYDIDQIPDDCTVEVMNRLEGLDLVDKMTEEIWMEVCNISPVHSLSRVQLFATPWTTAREASLSITSSWNLPKLMSSELFMANRRGKK